MPADDKTHERPEGAAKAVQPMHGDSVFANMVDPDPESYTSFGGDSTKPPAFLCSRDDSLVGNGAAAPKSCLSPLEMRSLIATGGVLAAGEASTTTRITFYQPLVRFCPNEETKLRTSILYAWYYSSFYVRAAPSCGRSLKQNPGTIGCSIQVVLKVVSAPARF